MLENCKQGARCQSSKCKLTHDCAHKAKCFNYHCKLKHPAQRLKPCREGASCVKSGKDCPFLHPKAKKKSKSPVLEECSPCVEGTLCLYYECKCSHFLLPPGGKERPSKCDMAQGHDPYCRFIHKNSESLYSFIRETLNGCEKSAYTEVLDLIRETLLAHMGKELRTRGKACSLRNKRVFAVTDSQRSRYDKELSICDNILLVQDMQRKQYEAFVSSFIPELLSRTGVPTAPLGTIDISNDVRELVIRASYKLRPFTLVDSDRRYTEPLPILASRIELCKAIAESEVYSRDKKLVLMVNGDTGSGKSTQIPLYLADYFTSREIYLPVVCTQPNDLATKSIAKRVGLEHSAGGQIQSPSREIGYKVSGRSRLGKSINFYSEEEFFYELLGLVRDKLPLNDKYACIIIDDAQQRSKFTDTIIGLLCCYTLRERGTPIIISSSGKTQLYEKLSLPHTLARHWKTLCIPDAYREHHWDMISDFMDEMSRSHAPGQLEDAEDLHREYSRLHVKASHLVEMLSGVKDKMRGKITLPDSEKLERLKLINLKCFELKGRPFPVTVQYPQIETTPSNYLKEAVRLAVKLSNSPSSGDILVFLSSRQETEKALRIVSEKYSRELSKLRVSACQLYEGQSSKEQLPILLPSKHRKIIFSTSLAETSLTVPGVRSVVDTGYVMSTYFDRRLRTDYEQKTRISRNSSDQRMGRAGRTAPGCCYRLYPKEDYEGRPRDKSPEILHCGLDLLFITLNAYKLWDQFFWIKSPSEFDTRLTKEYLHTIGAIYSIAGRTENSPFGDFLVRMRVPIRVGKLLYLSITGKISQASAGVTLASIVSLSEHEWWNFSVYETTPSERLESLLKMLGFDNAREIVSEGVIVALYYIYARWMSLDHWHGVLSPLDVEMVPPRDLEEMRKETRSSIFQEYNGDDGNEILGTNSIVVVGMVSSNGNSTVQDASCEQQYSPSPVQAFITPRMIETLCPGMRGMKEIPCQTTDAKRNHSGCTFRANNNHAINGTLNSISQPSAVSFRGDSEISLHRKVLLMRWIETRIESCLKPGLLQLISSERKKLIYSLRDLSLADKSSLGNIVVSVEPSQLKVLLLETFSTNVAVRDMNQGPFEYLCKSQPHIRGSVTPYISESACEQQPAILDESVLSYCGSHDDLISSWFQSYTEIELRFSRDISSDLCDISCRNMLIGEMHYTLLHRISSWYTELALGNTGTQTVIRLVKAVSGLWSRLSHTGVSPISQCVTPDWDYNMLLQHRQVCYAGASMHAQDGDADVCGEYYSYGFHKIIPLRRNEHKDTTSRKRRECSIDAPERLLDFPPILRSSPKFSIAHLEPSIDSHVNIIPRSAGTPTRVAVIGDVGSKSLNLESRISAFIEKLYQSRRDVLVDGFRCSFGAGLRVCGISDGAVYEEDCKLSLNIHWAEGTRKGNGILVYPNFEQGMKVLDSHDRLMKSQPLGESVKWVLRLPKKTQRKVKATNSKDSKPGSPPSTVEEGVFLISVSSLDSQTTETDIKDYVREWEACSSIVFFRDAPPSGGNLVGPSIPVTVMTEFVVNIEHDWISAQPNPRPNCMPVEISSLTSALTRSVSCSIGPKGRSTDRNDIVLGLKWAVAINRNRNVLINGQPLTAELEFIKILTIHREVSVFFQEYLDSVIESAATDRVEIILLAPKLGEEDLHTYQLKVVYDSANMEVNLETEHNRVMALNKFAFLSRNYHHHGLSTLFTPYGRKELHRLTARKIQQGYSRSGFIFVEKHSVKLYGLSEGDISESTSQLDNLISRLLRKPPVKLDLYPYKIKEQLGKISKLVALTDKVEGCKISVRADEEQLLHIRRIINSYKPPSSGENVIRDGGATLRDVSMVSRAPMCCVCKGMSGDSSIVELACGHVFCLHHLEQHLVSCDPLSPLKCIGTTLRAPTETESRDMNSAVQIIYEHLVGDLPQGSMFAPAFIRDLNSHLTVLSQIADSYDALSIVGSVSRLALDSPGVPYKDKFGVIFDFAMHSHTVYEGMRKLATLPTGKALGAKEVLIEPLLSSPKRDIRNLFNLEKLYLSLVHIVCTLSRTLERIEQSSERKELLRLSQFAHAYLSAVPSSLGTLMQKLESLIESFDWVDEAVAEQLLIISSARENPRLKGIISEKYPSLRALESLYLAHFDSFPSLPPNNALGLLVRGETCGKIILYDDLASHVRGKVMRSNQSLRLEAYCKSLPSYTVLAHEMRENCNHKQYKICFLSERDQEVEDNRSDPLIMQVDFPRRWSHPFSDPNGSMEAVLYDSNIFKGSVSLQRLLEFSDDSVMVENTISNAHSLIVSLLKLGGSLLKISLSECLYFRTQEQLWLPNASAIQSGIVYPFRFVQDKLRQSDQVSPEILRSVGEGITKDGDSITWTLSRELVGTQSSHLFAAFLRMLLGLEIVISQDLRNYYEQVIARLQSRSLSVGNVFRDFARKTKTEKECDVALEVTEPGTEPRFAQQLRIPYWLFNYELMPECDGISLVAGTCYFPESPSVRRPFELAYQPIDRSSLPAQAIQKLCNSPAENRAKYHLAGHWSSCVRFPVVVHDFTKDQNILPDEIRSYLHGNEVQPLLFFLYEEMNSDADSVEGGNHITESDDDGLYEYCARVIWRVAKLQQFLISSRVSHPLLYEKLRIQGEDILVGGCETLCEYPREEKCADLSLLSDFQQEELRKLASFIGDFLCESYGVDEPSVRLSAIIPHLRSCTETYALDEIIQCVSNRINTDYTTDETVLALLSPPCENIKSLICVKDRWAPSADHLEQPVETYVPQIIFRFGLFNF